MVDNKRPERDDRSADRGRNDRARGDRSSGRSDRPATGRTDRAQSGRVARPSFDRGDRPQSDRGDRPQSSRRDDGRGARDERPRPMMSRDSGPREPPRPGLERKANEPSIPDGVDTRELHRAVRAELRGLPKDLAEIVASHLVVAGQLIDDDPELAYSHAEAARRRAARLPIVREATAETAYAAGHYDVALSEFRALRRMTGTQDYLPVMADCERALGRPLAALKLAKESHRFDLELPLQIEMMIVESGARSDLDQEQEALRILQRAIAELTAVSEDARVPKARLRFAYADALLRQGKESEARRWFAQAAKLDHENSTDAQARLDQLDGFLIDYDQSDCDAESDADLDSTPPLEAPPQMSAGEHRPRTPSHGEPPRRR